MDFHHSCHDLISKLPQDIIEAILTKLPIRDAVRTCILSRSWRHKWTSMTLNLFEVRVGTSHQNIVPFLNGFLSMHVGPMHKFALRANCFDYDFLEVDRWIPYVCRKDVKELILRWGYLCQTDVRVPPCIFSCKNLTRLELVKCVVEPPPSFAGFSCMKHLVLRDVTISCEDVERLVSSCPLIESLTLLVYNASSELTIRAPNLRRLDVEGGFRDICLENAPLLVDITVSLDWSESIEDSSTNDCLEKLLGGIPKIERLCVQDYFTHYLSAGCGGRRFITYGFLKHIELSSLYVENSKEVLVALHLIFSSPNLQELHIECRSWSYPYEENRGPTFLDYFKDPFLANRTMVNCNY